MLFAVGAATVSGAVEILHQEVAAQFGRVHQRHRVQQCAVGKQAPWDRADRVEVGFHKKSGRSVCTHCRGDETYPFSIFSLGTVVLPTETTR